MGVLFAARTPAHKMKRIPLLPDIFVRALLATCCLSLAGSAAAQTPPQAPGSPRTRVGVALGGGSARSLAHVGVLKWLEEHRIPVDVLSGTSMGGLVGGSHATGLTPLSLSDDDLRISSTG
jgi:NTE family protein